MRAGSVSPVRRRNEPRFSPGFERSGGALRSHVFGRGRYPASHRDHSPPYGRGRFAGKGYDRPGHGRGPLRVESLPRNNPNVQPREGDWLCSDPLCKNLNFARRDNCNNCNRPRYGPGGSPRRGYPAPPFPSRQRFPSPPPPPFVRSHSPRRIMNGSYNRSPPRIYAPRDLSSGPLQRRNARFPDYPEDDPVRDRYRHDRPIQLGWAHRDRGRDSSRDVGGYGRRVMSPELPPHPPVRERTRSPVRGGVRPRDYPPRDLYMNRGRGGERRVGREAF